MIHLFYLFSVIRISLAYTFYYTINCSYEEQNQKGVSELVQKLRIVLKNKKKKLLMFWKSQNRSKTSYLLI